MNILKQEKISAYSHGLLVPVMLAAAILLAVLAGRNIKLTIFVLIYGISAITLFTASFLYHAKKKSVDERSVWRRLDRSAIFVLIAGTATPMCFLYLEGTTRILVLAAQWLLVAAGISFCFFTNARRKISTVLYLAIGGLIIFPFMSRISIIPPGVLHLFFAGVIFYSAGALVYALKKPNTHIPNMGFHEVFHMFVIAGAVFHMLMIIQGVNLYIG